MIGKGEHATRMKILDAAAEEVLVLEQILQQVTNKKRIDFTDKDEHDPGLVSQDLLGEVR